MLEEVRQGGSDKQVCGRCYVASIDQGRIEVREYSDGSWAMFWTLVEFEAMDPVIELTKDGTPKIKKLEAPATVNGTVFAKPF